MSQEEYIISGPKVLQSLPKESLGELIFHKLISNQTTIHSITNVSNGATISYGTFFQQTCKITAAFKKFGLRRNDVISICSENSLNYFQPVIAALYLGIITAPMNFNYTAREILNFALITKPKIIFCSKQSMSRVLETTQNAPFVKKIILFESDEEIDATQTLNSFINEYSGEYLNTDDGIVLKDINVEEQIALILYSSGTTGLPKGVMITHRNIHALQFQLINPPSNMSWTDDYVITFMPFFHAFGFMLMLSYIISCKAIMVLTKFDEKIFLETIQNYKITKFLAPPTIAVRLATSTLTDQFDLSHIKEITLGSAPLNTDIEKLLKKKLKGLVMRQCYGLTEATIFITAMPVDEERFGSVGKVV